MIRELLSIFLPAIDLSSPVFLVLCIWVKLGIVVRCLGSLLQDLEYFLVWLCARLFLMESGRGLGLSSTVLWLDESRTRNFFWCKIKEILLRLWILFFNDENWPI